MILRSLASASACLVLCMCSSPSSAPKLSLGMTKPQVEALYGVPLNKVSKRDGGESWFYDLVYTTTQYETQQTSPVETRNAAERGAMAQSEQAWSVTTSSSSMDHTHRASVDFNRSSQVIAIPRGTPAGVR